MSLTDPPPVDVDFFRTEGFLVLRQFFDPRPLMLEVDRVLSDAFPSSAGVSSYGGIQFQYVPMMTGSTPVSLSLLDRCELVAAIALGGSVIPTRAKAVRYFGDTSWHVDSNSPVSSMGILAYLEPLEADTGALRVLPGSHRQERADAFRALGGTGMPATALPSHILATQPGDIILIDEHLAHASVGGGNRRQWRVDYISDPVDAAMRSRTIAYLANLYAPDWNGGYDVDRYPSYGPDWLGSGRPAVARLKELGVYEMASRQEAFTRGKCAEGLR